MRGLEQEIKVKDRIIEANESMFNKMPTQSQINDFNAYSYEPKYKEQYQQYEERSFDTIPTNFPADEALPVAKPNVIPFDDIPIPTHRRKDNAFNEPQQEFPNDSFSEGRDMTVDDAQYQLDAIMPKRAEIERKLNLAPPKNKPPNVIQRERDALEQELADMNSQILKLKLIIRRSNKRY